MRSDLERRAEAAVDAAMETMRSPMIRAAIRRLQSARSTFPAQDAHGKESALGILREYVAHAMARDWPTWELREYTADLLRSTFGDVQSALRSVLNPTIGLPATLDALAAEIERRFVNAEAKRTIDKYITTTDEHFMTAVVGIVLRRYRFILPPEIRDTPPAELEVEMGRLLRISAAAEETLSQSIGVL